MVATWPADAARSRQVTNQLARVAALDACDRWRIPRFRLRVDGSRLVFLLFTTHTVSRGSGLASGIARDDRIDRQLLARVGAGANERFGSQTKELGREIFIRRLGMLVQPED
jgi:hypothetical protein